jgi:hypothetical protein
MEFQDAIVAQAVLENKKRRLMFLVRINIEHVIFEERDVYGDHVNLLPASSRWRSPAAS